MPIPPATPANALLIRNIPVDTVHPLNDEVPTYSTARNVLEWKPRSTSPGSGAPADATYVVMSLNPTLTNERRLQVGVSLTLADGGANGDVTLNTIQDIRVTATPTFAGLFLTPLSGMLRAGVAGEIFGGSTTTNLPEGTNLYFTESRVQELEDPLIYALMGA